MTFSSTLFNQTSFLNTSISGAPEPPFHERGVGRRDRSNPFVFYYLGVTLMAPFGAAGLVFTVTPPPLSVLSRETQSRLGEEMTFGFWRQTYTLKTIKIKMFEICKLGCLIAQKNVVFFRVFTQISTGTNNRVPVNQQREQSKVAHHKCHVKLWLSAYNDRGRHFLFLVLFFVGAFCTKIEKAYWGESGKSVSVLTESNKKSCTDSPQSTILLFGRVCVAIIKRFVVKVQRTSTTTTRPPKSGTWDLLSCNNMTAMLFFSVCQVYPAAFASFTTGSYCFVE